MIKWLRKNNSSSSVENSHQPSENPTVLLNDAAEKTNFYSRFKESLSKTRQQLGASMGRLLLGKKIIDAEIFEELEALLLRADLGVETTNKLLADLSVALGRNELTSGESVYLKIQQQLQAILAKNIAPINPELLNKKPFVILMVGVNGAGKTTTIGKLAKQFQQQNKKVMLAAGDTFRAAAVEQLKIWGERNNIQVIAQGTGADSASVSYDALQAAKARNVDILIIDTAGRLHTQQNLMEELKKVKRVLKKIDVETPHETMLVLDASIGQNALSQAREFNQAIGLTGITLTKLDGTAKGGIVFAIADELNIPFRYLGVGEDINDLRSFEAHQFVKAIFNDD